jgi:type IV secretory pathway VirB10-like protein
LPDFKYANAWKQPSHDSEGREILYGPDDVAYIITGVPRSDRDPEYFARLQRESERADYETPNKPLAYQPPVETKNIPPLPKPAPQPERPPEPQQIRTQVRCPDPETGDPGQILEGYFDVRGGLLYVWNETDASPIGTTPIKPGDDPAVAARKLLREKSGKSSSFYQPIRYPRGSVH